MYLDAGQDIPVLVILKEGIFVEPEGGWNSDGRKYQVVEGKTNN